MMKMNQVLQKYIFWIFLKNIFKKKIKNWDITIFNLKTTLSRILIEDWSNFLSLYTLNTSIKPITS